MEASEDKSLSGGGSETNHEEGDAGLLIGGILDNRLGDLGR